MAAICLGSVMVWNFVQKIPESISQNHDALIEMRVEQRIDRRDIKENKEGQSEASIERKAMVKAITMMAGDLKHLSETVESKSDGFDKKLDRIGDYWRDFNAPPDPSKWMSR